MGLEQYQFEALTISECNVTESRVCQHFDDEVDVECIKNWSINLVAVHGTIRIR